MNILTLRRERVGRNLIHAMLRIIFNTCVLRIKRKIKSCFFKFSSSWFVLKRRVKKKRKAAHILIFNQIIIWHFSNLTSTLQWALYLSSNCMPSWNELTFPILWTQPRSSQMTRQTLLLLWKETWYYYKWRGQGETKHLSDELFSTGWQMMAHNCVVIMQSNVVLHKALFSAALW